MDKSQIKSSDLLKLMQINHDRREKLREIVRQRAISNAISEGLLKYKRKCKSNESKSN